jgi:GTPase SAR1 family protein
MTIGVDFLIKNLEIRGIKVKLQIWFFRGDEHFRFLLPTCVRGANGGICMYDIKNYSSLTQLDDWLVIIKKGLTSGLLFSIIIIGYNTELSEDRAI